MQKSLWAVSISTFPEAEDATCELLQEYFNEPSSTYTDVETGISTATTYLAKKPDWTRARKILKAGLARVGSFGLRIGTAKISLQKVRRENWAESWKRHFQPIEIGDSLLIKPSWSKYRATKKQSVVVLDPGLSFGTGQHPTTSFCLEQIVACVERFRKSSSHLKTRNPKLSLLDIGTGSGILAIAAAKLGYAPVEAFDFDPEAVANARTNARRNRVAEKIRIYQADVTKLSRKGDKRHWLVCANLISNLLIS